MVRWLLRLHLRKSEPHGKEPLQTPHLVSGTGVLALMIQFLPLDKLMIVRLATWSCISME